MVDEQRVIDTLEAASDYERGVKRLDGPGKAIVTKLRELAGDLAKVAGKKRKRTFFWGIFFHKCNLLYFGKAQNTRRKRKRLRKNQNHQQFLFS